jgi:SET domain-containing protein
MPVPRKPRQKRSAPSRSSKQAGHAARKATSRAAERNDDARPKRAYSVRNSPIHGRGVFATRTIAKGTDIIEYRGRRISMDEADELPDSDPDNPFHTFLFELNDGRVIDAGVRGNAARWINHSCQPNCEPYEDAEGHVFIAAKRTIRVGEELAYDYKLNVPGRRTARVIASYACRCGAPRCRVTMLDPGKRKRK